MTINGYYVSKSGLGAGQSLHLNVIMIGVSSIWQGLVGAESPAGDPNCLGNSRIGDKGDDDYEQDVN